MKSVFPEKNKFQMTKVIYNGRIYLDREKFCEAVIINDSKIYKTGSSKDLLDIAPKNTQKIDANGSLVLPAFYDSHLHLMWIGRRASGIECVGIKSIEDIIRLGRETVARLKPAQGAYIQGSGVDPDRFNGNKKRDLCREDLDKITEHHPLILSRHCGHTVYCNSLALKIAGLSESAPEIKGGTIEKNENGKPTGVLRENAAVFIQKRMPFPSIKEMKNWIRLAMKKSHSMGITACGSYDVDGSDYDDVVQSYREVYDEYKREGKPGLRIGMQLGISGCEKILKKHIQRNTGTPLWQDTQWGTFLSIQSIKLFADGTLGGRTAFMRKPYYDDPNTTGFLLMERDKLDRLVQKAAENGMQVLIHAIGDAGIDTALCAFERVTCPGSNPLRHGIIHCQITTPDLLERMARNKILALVQPGFLADDIHILESRVGNSLASASYAWNSMLNLGIPVNFSTDAPVSQLNPFHCIEWAVNRGGFSTHEKVDIFTAIEAYTRGYIKPGMPADIVFLDRDIFAIPNDEINKTRILRTVCAGETVHEG